MENKNHLNSGIKGNSGKDIGPFLKRKKRKVGKVEEKLALP